jgi:hypothetical protein
VIDLLRVFSFLVNHPQHYPPQKKRSSLWVLCAFVGADTFGRSAGANRFNLHNLLSAAGLIALTPRARAQGFQGEFSGIEIENSLKLSKTHGTDVATRSYRAR